MSASKPVLWASVLSGVLTYLLIRLAGNMPDWLPLHADLFRYAPGFLFGAMALQLGAQGVGRRIGVVLAAGLIWILMYRLAVHLVSEQEQSVLLACGIAGGVGAWLAALLVKLLRPRRLSLLAALMAFVSGTIGGCLIGEGLLKPDESWLLDLLLLSGFVLWQAGVAGSLLLVDELGENEPHF